MSDEYEYESRFAVRPLVIGAGVVIALCVAFLVGHGSAGSRPATHDGAGLTQAPMTPNADTPTTVITAPAELRGPLSRNSAGVITGYSHDQQGAVAAAGNYTAAVYVHTNRTHARELTVLNSIAATPADAARMANDFSSEDFALARLLDVAGLQSPGAIAYGHPLGYRVESVSDTRATIDVYVVGGQGVAGALTDSAATGETFYEVDEVQLSWQQTGGDGDWRMTDWSHLVQDNGPELATIAAEGYQPFPIGQTDEASRK